MKHIELVASFYLDAESTEAGEQALRAVLEKALDQEVINTRLNWKIVEGYDHGEA